MIISIEETLKRGIVKNRDFGDGEGLVEPEGAAIDIRVGEIWEMNKKSDAFLGKIKRKTRKYIKRAGYKPGTDTQFDLKPNVYYQFKSVEELDILDDITGRFIARYNLLVNGIMVLGYKVDPGFKGAFSVPLINLSGVSFTIELGARFAQFQFHQILGKSVPYRGQWKDGRLFTEDEEVQV